MTNYQTLNDFYKLINTLDCTDEDKVIFTLCRYGVKSDNLTLIKWSNIDRENMKIGINGLSLPIDDIFLNIIDKIKSDDETILNKDLTRESIYNKAVTISRNNNIIRISLNELRENRIFDLLIEIYNKNNRLVYNDFKEIIDIFYRESKLTVLSSMVDTFEKTMNIKVTRAV